MSLKPVFRRALARRDLETASDYYEAKGGPDLGARFLDAVQEANGRIGRYPGAGSQHYGREAGISGLRSRPVRRFPYLILYVETHDSIEIWRVLHSHSDIPARLLEEEIWYDPEAEKSEPS